MANVIRITARHAGYRRCGIAHAATPTDYPMDKFTPAQLDVLLKDSGLVVVVVDPDAQAKLQADVAKRLKAEADAATAEAAVKADEAAAAAKSAKGK